MTKNKQPSAWATFVALEKQYGTKLPSKDYELIKDVYRLLGLKLSSNQYRKY